MKTAKCRLESMSPYSQSKMHEAPAEEGELKDAYERRTWRERAHVDDEGNVFIPPMQFKNCLSEAAKFLSIQIPGKGKSTYTKHFEAGVLVVDPTPLPIAKNELEYERLFVPADGRRGGGNRVWRHFPVIREWTGEVEFIILDDIIDEDVFRKVLDAAGKFVGIGRFRPRNNGFYGRFQIVDLDWTEGL